MTLLIITNYDVFNRVNFRVYRRGFVIYYDLPVNEYLPTMKLEDTLKETTQIIQTWKETPFDDLNQSAELMKDMAIVLYELTRHKVKFKKDWNAKCFSLRDDMSVAAAEREANISVPELDTIRQVIRAGNNILDSIRSQVSLLKTER